MGQDDRKWCRDDERLVSFAGCLESETPLGGTCSFSWNRLVRPRMLGGVGRVPGNGHPYPISDYLRGVASFSVWVGSFTRLN
jgi:hypothetical protein